MKSRIVFKYSLMLLDGIVLYTIFLVYSALRTDVEFVSEYWYRAVLPLVITWVVIDSVGGYNRNTDMQSLSYTSKHILAVGVIFVMTVLMIYFFSYKPSLQFSRSVLPSSFITFFFISLAYRRIIHSRFARVRRRQFYIVIGTGETAQELYRAYMESSIEQSLRFFDINEERAGTPIDGDGSPIIEGNLLHLLRNVKRNCAGIVATETKETLGNEIYSLLVKLHFQNIPMIPIRLFFEQNFKKIPLFILNKWWLIEDDLLLAHEPFFHNLKRGIDLAAAVVLSVITSPLLIIIASAIRLESKGPAIFKQIRLGKNEVPFTMFKFRTMYEHADLSEKYTHAHDSRITKIGKFLRLLRVDELPQLINVIIGEMSMIGPRAEWIDVTREYEKKIQYYNYRHIVKPGITGWAQVNYKYGENINDTIEKLQYDLFYISHYSFLLDFDIFLKTLYVIVLGKGR